MESKYDRIERLRKQQRLTTSDLTKKAELSENYLQQLERFPERDMKGEIALRIATALKTTPQHILYNHSDTVQQSAEKEFQIDYEILSAAALKTDQTLVDAKVKIKPKARFKMITYHYEVLYRQAHNLPPLEQDNEINPEN